jgi:chromosome segregation ATPase
MATNLTDMATRLRLREEGLRAQRQEREAERAAGRPSEPASRQFAETEESAPDADRDFALFPLVDKIAYTFASGLIVAMRELEQHIAGETNKVSESVGRSLDSVQASLRELTEAASEQRSLNAAVQQKCRELEAITTVLQESEQRQDGELNTLRANTEALSSSVAERFDQASASRREMEARHQEQVTSVREELQQSFTSLSSKVEETAGVLREAGSRNAADISSLRSETGNSLAQLAERVQSLANELEIQQADLTDVKSSLGGFCSKVDGFAERLERQAEALRSLFSTYSQRETQLEQLVDGLARLRGYPAPVAGQF